MMFTDWMNVFREFQRLFSVINFAYLLTYFDAELHAWRTRTSDWPANRTFEMFRDWFDVIFVSAISDLCEGPILYSVIFK